MIPSQSATEILGNEVLRSVTSEIQASNTLLDSEMTGLRIWEVPFAIIFGLAVAGITYAVGKQVLSAAAMGVAVAALHVAIACAGETRRLNRHIIAVLQLHKSRENHSKTSH